MRRRAARTLTALLAAMLLTACGTEVTDVAAPGDAATADPMEPVGDGSAADPGAAAGACLAGATDCDDIPGLADEQPLDETGVEQFRRDAQAILGWDEAELSEFVRVARRGDEQFALTEDYVIGRLTAELDDLDGDGTFTVTQTTVELPDGPETYTADEG